MKILFVENRYCTRIWAAVGKHLERQGHKVAHMVQNPIFAPSGGHNFVLPFPASKSVQAGGGANKVSMPDKLRSDRAARYWGGTTRHYEHYFHEIGRVIDQFQPDVIFGEPTQFHEILTIEAARSRGIPFLFPSSTRYPSGRMVFLRDDTMEPVGGEGSQMTAEQARELREQIVSRKTVPSYMMSSPETALQKACIRLIDKLRVATGWLRGERYVTPSPLAKLGLEKRQSRMVARWEQLALIDVPAELERQPWVLYAMQMQPESNMDVWGHPWNDQAALIDRAAKALATMGAALVVKPNPKSKYELNQELLEVIARHHNIHVLSHASKMGDVFPGAHAVLSVTGTIILECVMAGKPVGVLGEHALAYMPGVTRIASPEKIAELLNSTISGAARKATEFDAIKVLQTLYETSYPGVLYDPLLQSNRATAENLDTIASSFSSVLGGITKRWSVNVFQT